MFKYNAEAEMQNFGYHKPSIMRYRGREIVLYRNYKWKLRYMYDGFVYTKVDYVFNDIDQHIESEYMLDLANPIA